jgi:5,10-methylene-tetrahydrofolate dehydrogenase/methenyl tetrahydrofolate cyclohydrolase
LCNLGCDVAFQNAVETAEPTLTAEGYKPKARIPSINRGGEIIVSCVNKPGYLTRSRLARNSIVIDNGYNFYRGRIGGDVDFSSNQNWAKAITPVPGGVKSIAQVVTMLNFARLLRKLYGLSEEESKKDQITRRFHQVDKKLEANRSRI